MEEQTIQKIGSWTMTLFLPILITIIGYLLALFIKRLLISVDSLDASTKKLGESVSGMNAIVLANDHKLETYKSDHRDKHNSVDTRLNKHSELLDKHGNRITALEQKTIGT